MDIGTIVMIVILLLAPVGILMSGALASAGLGALLNKAVDDEHEGTELYEIWGK